MRSGLPDKGWRNIKVSSQGKNRQKWRWRDSLFWMTSQKPSSEKSQRFQNDLFSSLFRSPGDGEVSSRGKILWYLNSMASFRWKVRREEKAPHRVRGSLWTRRRKGQSSSLTVALMHSHTHQVVRLKRLQPHLLLVLQSPRTVGWGEKQTQRRSDLVKLCF